MFTLDNPFRGPKISGVEQNCLRSWPIIDSVPGSENGSKLFVFHGMRWHEVGDLNRNVRSCISVQVRRTAPVRGGATEVKPANHANERELKKVLKVE